MRERIFAIFTAKLYRALSKRDSGLGDLASNIILSNDPGKKGSNFFCCGAIRFPHIEMLDRKSTRLNSSHLPSSRMPSSA